MNTFIFFLFFLTFNLNAEQPKTQKHQEIEKSNLISVQENPATFQQKTTLNTDTQVKTNKKENSVSKIKTPQKSDNNLSNKETSAPTESDVTQESSLSTDNREKESAVLPIDNREKESPPQSVQSIDNQAPLPLESNENEESPATQEDNEEEKDFSQPTSYIEKESSPPESNKNKEPPAQKPSFSIELEAEGGLIKKPLSKNQKGFYPDIPYIELSFEYNILSDLQFFTEMEFGSKQNLWETELEQVGLFYRSNRFDLKVGRIPVSLGYSYANSKLFVKPLSFYKLFRANPMDIGLRLDVPLYKEYLNLSISRFKGYLKRSFDNFYKPPEFAPMTISLKGKGPSWNGFITYLKQNLAFQESLHVLGGGFVFKTPTFPGSLLSLQGEVWGGNEKLQSSFAYYLFPKLSFQKYELGVFFGGIKNFAPNFQDAKTTSSIYEWILQGSYELLPGVFLIGERFITKQKKGPLINNIWALRLKTKLKF